MIKHIILILLFNYIYIYSLDQNNSDSLGNRFDFNSDSLLKSNLNYSKLYNFEIYNCDSLTKSNDYDITNLTIIGGMFAVAGISIHQYIKNTAWKNVNNKFISNFGASKCIEISNLGYFFSTNLTSHFFTAGFENTKMNYESAVVYGSLLSVIYAGYFELMNGFYTQNGFSNKNILSSLLGSCFAMGQYYFPYLKNFQPKISYYPSSNYKNISSTNFVNDYAGQKYWLGLRIKEIMPESVSKYWPSILMLSIGVAPNKNIGKSNEITSGYISFDIDAEQIPLYGKFWQFIKNTFTYFHFPLPGIKFTNKTIIYGFCY